MNNNPNPNYYREAADQTLHKADEVTERLLRTLAQYEPSSTKEVIAGLRDDRRFLLYRAKVLADLYSAIDTRAQFDSAEPEVLTKAPDGWLSFQPGSPTAIDFGRCPVCDQPDMARLPDDWQKRVDDGYAIPIVGCGNPWHYATRDMSHPPVSAEQTSEWFRRGWEARDVRGVDEPMNAGPQPGVTLPAELQARLDFLSDVIGTAERYRRAATLAAVEAAEEASR